MAKKKKWKKTLKKIAKAAIIGGALYAGAKALKGRKGNVSKTAASEDANIGVTHSALTPNKNWIKKTTPVKVSNWISPRMKGHDPNDPTGVVGQKKRANVSNYTYTPPVVPTGTFPGTTVRGRKVAKKGGRIRKQFGGGLPVGGTARRDMRSGYYPSDMGMRGGSMYKKGGRVKSMGAAKRGGGIAKR